MAADQRKRRLSGSTTAFGYGSQEQYRAKKRVLGSPQYDLNCNSHISLKWDDNGKRVVAKEDQVGISWRHLSAFVPCTTTNSKLADVVTVPREVFELNDLTGVLSYEVWESLLTEKERNYLAQFLPRGHEPDHVVEPLLAGENIQFGNPFLKWGASLCSGDLHPDAIMHHEKSFKTNKKAYYSELQQYHDNMIRNLQKLKVRCESSKDPEAEILQMKSRSKRYAEKTVSPDANGFRPRRPEENVGAMSESLSSIADEKLYYSDNQKLSVIRDAEIQRRIRNQDFLKDKYEKSVASTDALKGLPRHKKAEKLQKGNLNSNDGAKYMSYVKISKKQHELVKSMKQSGSSIQSKSLNRVLGNLDSFNVKPYEMFVEEEQKRIHEYWSNLANNDLPAAVENWRIGQSERQKIMHSLGQELEEKQRFLTKDQDEKSVESHDEKTAGAQDMDGESSRGTSEQDQYDESGTQGSVSDSGKESSDSDKESSDSDKESTQSETSTQNHPPLNVNKEFDPSSIENQSSLQNAPLNVNEGFSPSSVENHSSMHNPPLNVNEEFNPMDLNTENNHVTSETSGSCSTMPEENIAPRTSEVSLTISHPESLTSATAANASEEMPCSSLKNGWPSSVGLAEPYCHTTTTQYPSSSGLSLRHPQAVPIQPARLIDLESDMPEEDTTKDLLNSHANHMFFNPYPNRDRNELLQSLIKRDSYHHQEPKKTGLEFHPMTNVLLEPPTLFPTHFREQLQPSFGLDHHRQKAQSGLFMNHNIQDSIYSDNHRYSIQGGSQDPFPNLNVRDWTHPRISTPSLQSSQLSSGELLNHNWFAGENRAAHHSGWSGPESTVFSSPSLGGGSGGDQSLYSVLSQCNSLHSRAPYNPVVSTDQQIIPPTNYGQVMAGGGIPMTSNAGGMPMSSNAGGIPMSSNALPQMASPFDYLSGNEAAAAAAATLKSTNMGWMTLGHQTPALHDPTGKPFLKSWNQ